MFVFEAGDIPVCELAQVTLTFLCLSFPHLQNGPDTIKSLNSWDDRLEDV